MYNEKMHIRKIYTCRPLEIVPKIKELKFIMNLVILMHSTGLDAEPKPWILNANKFIEQSFVNILIFFKY